MVNFQITSDPQKSGRFVVSGPIPPVPTPPFGITQYLLDRLDEPSSTPDSIPLVVVRERLPSGSGPLAIAAMKPSDLPCPFDDMAGKVDRRHRADFDRSDTAQGNDDEAPFDTQCYGLAVKNAIDTRACSEEVFIPCFPGVTDLLSIHERD